MRPTTALSMLAFALLLGAPVASAGDPAGGVKEELQCVFQDPDCLDPAPNPVACLMGPHIPETFVYYIVWHCATDGQVPEPVEYLTGCRVVFPGQIQCDGPLGSIGGPVWCTLQRPIQISDATERLDCFIA